MSTSRDSRIGLPLSIDSSTASSRARSWMMRAIRYRYLARSAPRIGPQTSLVRPPGGRDGGVHIGLAGLGDLGQDLLGGRVHRLAGAAADRRPQRSR